MDDASELTPATKKFILHWGELGTRWGLNRTVAQIHALLYLSPRPLHAAEIAERLDVARSNVSNSLRELQGWGVVRVVHVLGERRDHFETLTDVWEMFRIILEERKRREIDPTLGVLRQCAAELDKSGPDDEYQRQRVAAMLEFFETITAAYEDLHRMPAGMIRQAVKMKGRLRRLLERSK
jgi:DNA-binding transcriptional regulator GbsR (MarR family)